MFARLENNVVMELLDYPSLEGRFTDDIVAQCVPCDGTVTQGMFWDGELFGPAPAPERTADDIKRELEALDAEAIRPLHTVTAGQGTQDDLDKLADLEASKETLRAELAALESED